MGTTYMGRSAKNGGDIFGGYHQGEECREISDIIVNLVKRRLKEMDLMVKGDDKKNI